MGLHTFPKVKSVYFLNFNKKFLEGVVNFAFWIICNYAENYLFIYIKLANLILLGFQPKPHIKETKSYPPPQKKALLQTGVNTISLLAVTFAKTCLPYLHFN